MAYTIQQSNGYHGELLVATAFMTNFRWPCRLQSVDLGVDCEVELIDVNENSTGKVIKIQVKANSNAFKDGTNTVYLDRQHIDYWKKFSIPVLLCTVSLVTSEVLWRVIEFSKDYSTPKGAKIEFDRVNDALTPNSRDAIAKIATNGSDTLMRIIDLAERSVKRHLDDRGEVSISIEDSELINQHETNREIISLAYRLIDLSGHSATQTGVARRIDALNELWNRVDKELSRQSHEDLY